MDVVSRWHKLAKNHTSEGLHALLADEVQFHSPVVHTPQIGRAITHAYLSAAFVVLYNETFSYVREIVGSHSAMLEFELELDGIHVNGVDIISWDDTGRIVDFKVMVRPLKAIDVVRNNMAIVLEAMQQANAS